MKRMELAVKLRAEDLLGPEAALLAGGSLVEQNERPEKRSLVATELERLDEAGDAVDRKISFAFDDQLEKVRRGETCLLGEIPK